MKKIIALAVATAISAPAMADLTVGGSARYQADNNAGGANAATGAAQGDFGSNTNRVLMSIAGSSTAESGMFVSATATLELIGENAGDELDADGNNSLTIGNSAANVVLGSFEPAGAFSSGADAFQHGGTVASTEGSLRARNMDNIGLNVTAVEGLTLQLSTDVGSQDDLRLVVGGSFGGVSVTGAYEQVDAGDNLFSITAGTSLGGVALNASYGKQGDNNSTNINASYMGFSLAVQNDEVGANSEQEIYGAYAIANAGGVEGFTTTVGFGTTDQEGTTEDMRYGVRFDYAF